MDPISTQLTKSALKNISSPDAAMPKPQNYQLEQSGFGQLLDQQMNASQTATDKLMSFVDNMSGQSSGAGMNAIPAGEIKVDLAKAGEVTASSGGNNSSVLDVFKEINGSQNNMDRLIETMSSGKKFSTQELLQFQVFAHHHTVTYEMMSKFGEMANRAIQTPFQMQV